MFSRLRIIFSIFLALLIRDQGVTHARQPFWKTVDIGLAVGEIISPRSSGMGDSKITVVKIDPQYYEFKLLCASEQKGEPRTLGKWAEEFNLLAAINAGMYQQDNLTSVGYLKNFDHLNNPTLNKNNAIFAFSPVDSSLKNALIIDRTCDDVKTLLKQYSCLLQSIRMISCDRQNVWSQQPRKWSMSVLASDREGNILFIFTHSPYSVHEFINILLGLPLSIAKAMYLEGGSAAALFFSDKDIHLEKSGLFESAILNDGAADAGIVLPNVLGIVKKERRE